MLVRGVAVSKKIAPHYLFMPILCLNMTEEDSATGDEAAGGGASEKAGSGEGRSGDKY